MAQTKNVNEAKAESRSLVTKSEAHLVNSQDDQWIKDFPAAKHGHTKTMLPVGNQKILYEQHNYEKLAITFLL